MAKRVYSNLQGLKRPSIFKAKGNVDEQFFMDTWQAIKSEVSRLINVANAADLNGNREKADLYYGAVNKYYYMLHLNIAIRKYMKIRGIATINDEVKQRYKLDCVEDAFQCTGNAVGTNYSQVWDSLNPTPQGEFTIDEFVINEFTKAFGVIYPLTNI